MGFFCYCVIVQKWIHLCTLTTTITTNSNNNMKAVVLQENLHKALLFVGKSAAVKTQLPILSHILIETDAGRLKLSSTNLETSISFWVGGSIETQGKVAVPARLFTELINTFVHDKVFLTAEKNVLTLSCGGSEATLSGIDVAEFPPLPVRPEKRGVEITMDVLKNNLPFVLISASTDESRPLLTGVMFESKDNQTALIATDGYRLSVKKLPQVKGIGEEIIISARTLGEAYRVMAEEKAGAVDLYLSPDKNQVLLVMPQVQIATRLIEGEYPTYEKIIPAAFVAHTEFDRKEMLQAVKLASVYAKESANIVRWQINKSSVVVSANSPQVGENKTSVSAKTQGEVGEIAFNARFLLDLFNVFPYEEIAFEMNGSLSPGVFRSTTDDSFLHIIMPVRLQN